MGKIFSDLIQQYIQCD